MNEERLNKLLEDIDNALYDLKICQCNINVTAKGHKWETYYGLDDDLIKYIRKIESSNKNLQSKIEKAIEYIENLKNFKIKYVMLEERELYASEKDFVKDLLDILRENE